MKISTTRLQARSTSSEEAECRASLKLYSMGESDNGALSAAARAVDFRREVRFVLVSSVVRARRTSLSSEGDVLERLDTSRNTC